MALRKLLEKNCVGPYCKDIDEFAFVLRIDGDIWYWNFSGCEKLRLSKKHKYITVDVGVPKCRWQGRTANEIRTYLADCVRQGLDMMVARLKKDKYEIDAIRLMADYERLLEDYL